MSVSPSAPLPPWDPEPFTPRPWAWNPHVQTLAGKFLRPRPPLRLRREIWETPDGDELVLDFAPEPEPDPHRPAGRGPRVVVLHGLEGHAHRPYVLLLHRELARKGIASVGLNFRGCARPNRTPRAYHSGETGDLAFVLSGLAAREPGRPLAAVGFSLGGNVLLKLLGDAGPDRTGLEAAVAISVPYDLAAGADVLERSALGRRYARYFLASLVAKVRAKRSLLEDLVDVEAALASPTIRAFDERVTAPLHGFRDADHYYAASSSAPVLPHIRVPTLLIHALDDPFLPRDRVPARAAASNPWLLPAFLDRGGHVGFVQGPAWRPRFWAERAAAGFLASALGRSTPATPRP